MVPIGLLAFVWWPYMGHAGNPTFLLSASGISSLYFCIISSPGTVTLDVMAQSQTLWIVSPKLVTNEALLEKMSNVSRLFLITLCRSLSTTGLPSDSSGRLLFCLTISGEETCLTALQGPGPLHSDLWGNWTVTLCKRPLSGPGLQSVLRSKKGEFGWC